MTAIQKACYCLTASAFVLGALLVLNLQGRFASSAQAEMVQYREPLTILTTTTMPGQESLFILDNTGQTLLVYNLDAGKHRMSKAGAVDLAALFGNAPSGGGPGGGPPGRMPR
jgi:hypothetical protein